MAGRVGKEDITYKLVDEGFLELEEHVSTPPS
jgi:hypothetical protein